ncbi:alpha 1,6 mannopyranosyltransferase [Corynebacterium yudongzhengii]|uniref:Alpha 1,6 mannopyranosyltransferase n=1 Tax=Corynebacterium yudongzhengii TaxID=2080740 RepID=A0A2U1T8G2_9CORY|nr:polyprenol phosphomannose-dependent alpha 1,6 mannosyltransferase MptB [Corynebacterium yudongzhengii]AWB81863.1 alpha 1,6 mannopyranosyltransferase [Corynebacterium yudongzhengii]PWC02255.1 alpha 1,6 mannopyranosyltransferase [Corynebacterium yudongzhengii]
MPLTSVLARLGRAGSRAAGLHGPVERPGEHLRMHAYYRFLLLRWIGTVGALLIGVAGLGAGALPVVDNPYRHLPLGDVMSRMLQTSSSLVLLGVGLLVLAWVLMWRYVGERSVTTGALKRTLAAWTLPILFTAPLFTQDIYSYLAQGAIVAEDMDPYSAGPVQLLGTGHPLARSVPFIWAESPSPYGPVALSVAAAISVVTDNSIVLGVLVHRFINVVSLIGAGWAVSRLAQRCGVRPATALWLGLLNPLTLLHLVGGIHNEAILLGLLLIGMEIGLRGIDRLSSSRNGWGLLVAASALITCAGLVKVTGFIGLGFLGMALARHLHVRGRNPVVAIGIGAAFMTVALVVTTVIVSVISGIGYGWITGQGGAATIRSWMSVTTAIGVTAGALGEALGLGDHTEAILTITRSVGILVAGALIVRMLFATFRGTIHPVGGLGVGTFVLVILFPVVHPWYMLWAILPLATWANRSFFRVAVVGYSAAMSFFVLPRGLALPAPTVITIYGWAIVAGIIVIGLGWWILRRARVIT